MQLSLPYYLARKLAQLKLDNLQKINELGYLEVYAQLKLTYPSLNYQALYDLYCLNNALSHSQLTVHQMQILRNEFKALLPKYHAVTDDIHYKFLKAAEEQAKLALTQDEIPIGAVVVFDEKIIGLGYNKTKTENNILAHAELIAIQAAQNYLGNHRLTDCDLYVTIEPCLMCSGAVIHSRIRRLIFGAAEPKTGACVSQYQVFNNKTVNHHCQVIGPVDQKYFSQLLHDFLRNKSAK